MNGARGKVGLGSPRLAVVLSALGTACSGSGARGPTEGEAWPIDLAGCVRVRADFVCEIDESTVLRLWIPAGSVPRISVCPDLDGSSSASEPAGNATTVYASRPVSGGRLYEIPVPAGSTCLVVRDETGGHVPYRASLARVRTDPTVARAVNLRAAARSDEAEALLRASLPSLPEPERASGRRCLSAPLPSVYSAPTSEDWQ